MSTVAKGFDSQRARRRVEGIAARELKSRGNQRGWTTLRFLGSLTHKGYVWRFDSVDVLCPKVYAFMDTWEQAGELISFLHKTAVSRGWDTILCLSP